MKMFFFSIGYLDMYTTTMNNEYERKFFLKKMFYLPKATNYEENVLCLHRSNYLVYIPIALIPSPPLQHQADKRVSLIGTEIIKFTIIIVFLKFLWFFVLVLFRA